MSLSTPSAQRVFISCHEDDWPLVDRLDEDLRKRGIETLRDSRDVRPGESRRWAAKRLVGDAPFFVACLSPSYLDDAFSRAQLFVARAYGRRVLPILVAAFPDGGPRAALLASGDRFTHAIKGLEELDIADFTGLLPRWGLGSYGGNFTRLVNAIRPVPTAAPLNADPIYVSYHYKQEAFAMRLARDLQLARGQVWFDKFNIDIGAHWRTAMYEGLRRAGHLVLCLTPEAARSENVNHEVLVAKLRPIPIHPVVSENLRTNRTLAKELDAALLESVEMRHFADIAPYMPAPGYPDMLEQLKRAVGLGDVLEEKKGGIFISYRRTDSQAITGRIHERLVQRFGAESVFVDVDTIPAAVDFADYYTKWLTQKAAFVLVVIGKTWVSVKDDASPNGPPRLHDEQDHVRIEVATALGMEGLPVIPLLVDGAKMPPATDLPEALRRLPGISGREVRHDPDFTRDMERLIGEIVRLASEAAAVKE